MISKNVRNVGMTPEQIVTTFNSTPNAEYDNSDKTPWFIPPEGLEKFTIDKPCTVICDVLQFPMSIDINRSYYDMTKGDFTKLDDKFWYERPVYVHKNFPKQLVCARTFSQSFSKDEVTGKYRVDPQDSVCSYIQEDWNNRRSLLDNYSIFLLRLHPNADLGIEDYKFVVYVDKSSRFAKMLAEEYGLCINATPPVLDYLGFYRYDEMGRTIRARFTTKTDSFPTANGKSEQHSWVECTKLDFNSDARKKPLTDEEIEWIMNLDLDGCITRPTKDEYDTFMKDVAGMKTALKRDVPERPMNPTVPKEENAFLKDDTPDTGLNMGSAPVGSGTTPISSNTVMEEEESVVNGDTKDDDWD